ncbi:Estradiol 17-beta-dehydrogenase 2 [Sarcoptes scabiei]|uniref:Estradiol 17-beta-dehydrogenase 2 n=1 Tax=Sarcoptes scabiei TaxID=52283 RepID=A0A834R9H2_SARSC|nr:Estradiol 17-beta-dehydrogenase 2 [Sarcoptes scabiei]
MFLRLITYVLPSFLLIVIIRNLINLSVVDGLFALIGISITSWLLGYYLFESFNQETIDPKNKIILITGCDTGFGNRLAYKLDQLGFHVYAGVLSTENPGAIKLAQQCSNRMKVVPMDITKPEQVKFVVERIRQEKLPLWAIVNNAGIFYTMPSDWGNDVDVLRKTFEVNVFGAVRVTNSCLMLLRRSKGRIINISSVAGRVNLQYMSHYGMSKFAVRSYSDILRRELASSGIKVVVIEPSFYRTNIIDFDFHDRMREKYFNESSEEIKQHYGVESLKSLATFRGVANQMTNDDIDQVIDSMIKGIVRKYPKLYYRCGSYLDIIKLWGLSYLPEIIQDKFIAFTWNK